MKKRSLGFDGEGRNWVSDRLCVVEAVCPVDGKIRRVFVKNGDFDSGDAYTEINGLVCHGYVLPLIDGDPVCGPHQFISEYHLDKANAAAAAEWE